VPATVGDQQVTRKQVDEGMAFLEHESKLDGRPFPAKGSPARDRAEHDVLELLIRRSRFEAEAEDLGVGVTRAEVQVRIGGEESTGATPPGFSFHEATIRAGLLYGKLFDRVTSGVTVPAAAVRRFYDTHRKAYPQPFAEVRDTLRAQLLTARKTATMRRWERQIERELPAHIRS
jgi:hypothetical protein